MPKVPKIPEEDATIERELWAGDQANTEHEERAVRELYRRRLCNADLKSALREIAQLATQQHNPLLSVIEEIARRALGK